VVAVAASLDVRDGTFFSYVMNNYWYTDTPAQQGGQFTFRYALTSGPDVSIPDALAMAADARAPLFAIRRYSMGWAPSLDPGGTSFVEVIPPGARLLTMRPLEREGRYLLRVQNATPEPLDARIRFPRGRVERACVASVLGDCRASLDVRDDEVLVPFRAYDIKTVVIAPGRPAFDIPGGPGSRSSGGRARPRSNH
jgi:hypothetical protein